MRFLPGQTSGIPPMSLFVHRRDKVQPLAAISRSFLLATTRLTLVPVTALDIRHPPNELFRPQTRQSPAFGRHIEELLIGDDALNDCSPSIVSVHGEQPDPIVLQRQTVKDGRIVACHQDLTLILAAQYPIRKSLGERGRQAGVEAVIRVVHGTERRRFRVSGKNSEEEDIQSSLASVVTRKYIAARLHVPVTESDYHR